MSDQFYDKVSLLLPMFGSNNGTVFTDYSPVAKTISRFGNTVTVTAQSKYYGSSGYFDGTGDYLTLAANTEFYPSTDFTIEAWVYSTTTDATNQKTIFSNRTTNAGFWLYTGAYGSKILQVAGYYAGGTAFYKGSAGIIAHNGWTHVAATRRGTVWELYIDGVSQGTTTETSVAAAGSTAYIGREPTNTARDWAGYINDLRITKGVARYTSNFTPPARLVGQISGTVKDDTNANAIRKIVAFPRSAPLRVVTTDSAADGTYTLSNLPCTEHSVVCLDDTAGTVYNDLVHRVVPA
jgi:hypothetical protein